MFGGQNFRDYQMLFNFINDNGFATTVVGTNTKEQTHEVKKGTAFGFGDDVFSEDNWSTGEGLSDSDDDSETQSLHQLDYHLVQYFVPNIESLPSFRGIASTSLLREFFHLRARHVWPIIPGCCFQALDNNFKNNITYPLYERYL